MTDVGYGPKPTNQIVVAGEPLVQILKVETVTNVYPGRLVIKGTNDDDVKVCTEGALNAIGWAGYERTIKKYRPATVDTLYTASDQIAVLHGGKFIIVGKLATGANVAKGARLSCGEAGLLSGAVISGGMVAIAEETVDASSAWADIMVRSLI